MSAMKWTDRGVSCDHPDCVNCLWGSELDNRSLTLARIRVIAARRGWRVKVPRPGGGPTLDYCPLHAGDAG